MAVANPYEQDKDLLKAQSAQTTPPGTEIKVQEQPGYVDATGGGQQPPPGSVDPFAAMGGGTYVNGGWIPNNNPGAIAAARGQAPAPPAYGPSAQPGNAPPPTPYTSTPNMQQVQRDQMLALMTQNPVADQNDPRIQNQVQTFAAHQDRQRRQSENEAAERAAAQGLGESGALDTQRRAIQEKAGLNTASFEAEMRQRDFEQRKQEIQDYMRMNAATIDADQARMLQRELAQIDAQLRGRGLDIQQSLGNRELDVRSDLGNRGLENDLMRLLLQNKQFGQDLGFRIGATEADLNNQTMRYILGV